LSPVAPALTVNMDDGRVYQLVGTNPVGTNPVVDK
jgi:hypothetical protein